MIFEVIVSTVDEQDVVHVAPMGIRYIENFVVIAPFKPSQTLFNLQATGAAVVNITDDVRVYAGCITGRTDWPTRPATHTKGRVLEAAINHQELKVKKVVEDDLRPKVYLSQVHRSSTKPFAGFNRAQAAVVEAAILVSRLHMLPEEKINTEMAYLQIAIDKTAGPRELEAWQWLTDAIDEFRNRPATLN